MFVFRDCWNPGNLTVIALHVYGKLQIQVENFSKQLKTILMDKKMRKTTNLVVEIMSSKRRVKRKR